MPGSVVHLPPADGAELSEDVNATHPMRVITKRAALDQQWTAADRAEVVALFDTLSKGWHEGHEFEGRNAPVVDALARGGIAAPADGLCVELGPGTGLSTPLLVERWPHTVAVDLSMKMLTSGPDSVAPRVQADANQLPFPAGRVAVVVLVNMLLFPVEIDRVLADDGWLLWASTSGSCTPISLTAEELAVALPGSWSVTASSAGSGTWAVAHRAPTT